MTLARQVAVAAGCSVGRAQIDRFPDGEISIQIREDVQGDFVFVLQSLRSSDAILEILLLADALKRCKPHRMALIVPYFGYGRQERRTGQSPVSAQVIARLLNHSGADTLVTMDLHAPRISDFISLRHLHLSTSNLFAEYIRDQVPEGTEMVIVSPDAGGLYRARQLSRALGCEQPAVHLEKERLAPDRCRIVGVGEVVDMVGRQAIIVDDIVSTGGTLVQAAQWLAAQGAETIWACATHLLAAPHALARRLASSPIERLVVSNSLSFPELPAGSKIRTVGVAPFLASAVVCLGQPTRSQRLALHLRQQLCRPLARAAGGLGIHLAEGDG